MGWKGLASGARTYKKKLYLRERHFFVMEKYIEDAKQEEKDVPDLLESIMRPTCLAKEELRTNSCESYGLQTRLKKNTHFPSFFAGPGPGPGPVPGPCEEGWKI